MTARRTLTALVCVGLLGLAPTAALAQGAGADGAVVLAQAEPLPVDPGDVLTEEPRTDGGSADPEPSPVEPSGDDDGEDLEPDTSDVPQADGGEDGARLAQTGIDERLVVGIGLSMLLAGIGLRLRTLPERF